MQKQVKILDAQGRAINGQIVPDGGRLVLPSITLMDNETVSEKVVTDANVGRRPGSLPLTDSDRQRREAMYRKANASLSERWKMVAPSPPGRGPVGKGVRGLKTTPTARGRAPPS